MRWWKVSTFDLRRVRVRMGFEDSGSLENSIFGRDPESVTLSDLSFQHVGDTFNETHRDFVERQNNVFHNPQFYPVSETQVRTDIIFVLFGALRRQI